MLKIGVVGLQGDVLEHISSMENALRNMEYKGEVLVVKTPDECKKLDAVVIPGGESTTIGGLLSKTKMGEEIISLAKKNTPVMGTCAGLIVLAKGGCREVEKTRQPLLGLMDMEVDRNAFGRQRESFEADLVIPVLGRKKFRGIFIRAPSIVRVWGKARILAEYGGQVVMAEQGNILAVAFHPELGGDTRLHEYFLKKIRQAK